MNLNSALYIGNVEHRRLSPVKNIFNYSVCYYFVDLAEVQSLFNKPFLFSYNRPGLLSFNRKHYLGDSKKDLASEVSRVIKEETNEIFQGSIKILTNISYFGFCFNPVSFYYCYEEGNKDLKYIVSEITNTPWGEKHQNVFKMPQGSEKMKIEFKKDFHVSPFMPMEIDYTWIFHAPKEDLFVYMQNRHQGEEKIFFDTTLKLKKRELSSKNIIKAFLQFPFITFKTVLAIYYQAAKLYIKKVPFYTHPAKVKVS
jgi:DUF1365 family protein